MRYCARSARSAAGFSGLLRKSMPCSRASRRRRRPRGGGGGGGGVSGRRARGGDEGGGRRGAEIAAQLQDGLDAVALVEAEINKQAIQRHAGLGDDALCVG